MVKYSSALLDATFAALSDATRRAILAQLALGETSVTRLASRFEISLPGVTKHLRVLESAGLLQSTKTGRVRRCRLTAEPMKSAADWIAHYRQFWESQFDSLARYLEETQKQENASWPNPTPVRNQSSGSGARSRRRAKRYTVPGPIAKR